MIEDVPHLLKRWRTALLASNGALFVNGSRVEEWLAVARAGTTALTVAMMEGADVQSVRYARITFSIDVEAELTRQGSLKAAALCRTVRCWFDAFDRRGISETQRDTDVDRMLTLLLETFGEQWLAHQKEARKRFSAMPSHVAGLPMATLEGTVAACAARTHLRAVAATDRNVDGTRY